MGIIIFFVTVVFLNIVTLCFSNGNERTLLEPNLGGVYYYNQTIEPGVPFLLAIPDDVYAIYWSNDLLDSNIEVMIYVDLTTVHASSFEKQGKWVLPPKIAKKLLFSVANLNKDKKTVLGSILITSGGGSQHGILNLDEDFSDTKKIPVFDDVSHLEINITCSDEVDINLVDIDEKPLYQEKNLKGLIKRTIPVSSKVQAHSFIVSSAKTDNSNNIHVKGNIGFYLVLRIFSPLLFSQNVPSNNHQEPIETLGFWIAIAILAFFIVVMSVVIILLVVFLLLKTLFNRMKARSVKLEYEQIVDGDDLNKSINTVKEDQRVEREVHEKLISENRAKIKELEGLLEKTKAENETNIEELKSENENMEKEKEGEISLLRKKSEEREKKISSLEESISEIEADMIKEVHEKNSALLKLEKASALSTSVSLKLNGSESTIADQLETIENLTATIDKLKFDNLQNSSDEKLKFEKDREEIEKKHKNNEEEKESMMKRMREELEKVVKFKDEEIERLFKLIEQLKKIHSQELEKSERLLKDNVEEKHYSLEKVVEDWKKKLDQQREEKERILAEKNGEIEQLKKNKEVDKEEKLTFEKEKKEEIDLLGSRLGAFIAEKERIEKEKEGKKKKEEEEKKKREEVQKKKEEDAQTRLIQARRSVSKLTSGEILEVYSYVKPQVVIVDVCRCLLLILGKYGNRKQLKEWKNIRKHLKAKLLFELQNFRVNKSIDYRRIDRMTFKHKRVVAYNNSTAVGAIYDFLASISEVVKKLLLEEDGKTPTVLMKSGIGFRDKHRDPELRTISVVRFDGGGGGGAKPKHAFKRPPMRRANTFVTKRQNRSSSFNTSTNSSRTREFGHTSKEI